MSADASRYSAGRLLIAGFRPDEEDEVKGLLHEGRLGGVILFDRNCPDALSVAALVRRLRTAAASSDPDALPVVAVDQEQGRVVRIRDGVTLFPGAADLRRLNRQRTTERVASCVAGELAAVGVNLNLSPVGDVPSTNSASKVLQGRCFGDDPVIAAKHVQSWIEGSRKNGIASCVKHFPGHGAVDDDSHLMLPFDRSALEIIKIRHLPPFERAVRSNAAVVMIGHVAYDALDPGTPACLSSRIISGLLKEKMGFEGLVLTDDLDMQAVSSETGRTDAAVRSILAGADMALIGRNLYAGPSLTDTVEGLEAAAREGIILLARVDDAIQRINTFKERWVPATWNPPDRPPTTKAATKYALKLWKACGYDR